MTRLVLATLISILCLSAKSQGTFPGGNITPATFIYATYADSLWNVENTDLTTADFNGDNKPDIAIVDRLNNTLSIYINTSSSGNISFAPRIDLATGNYPWHVSAGDLNGDGKPELLVANKSDTTVSVYVNTSSGGSTSFAAPFLLATGTQPANMAIGDIDGDGLTDLLVSNFYFPGSFSAFRNTTSGGTLSFATGAIINMPGATGPVALKDMDGDGKPDIISAGSTSNMLFALKNTSTSGAMSFGTASAFNTGTYPSSLSVGDLDGDGRPDVATANFYSGSVTIYTNTSTGGILSMSRLDLQAGNSPIATVFCDADGDGHADLLVLNSYQSISIYRNTSTPGALSLAARVDVATPYLSTTLLSADWDGDGKTDVAGEGGIFRAVIWKNQADKPYIASFSPAAAAQGSAVTITGAGFTGATAVSFGGTPAASFTVNNSGSITATLAAGTSGTVSVTNHAGVGSKSGFRFLGPAVIQSFSPTSGSRGTVDTIKGYSFTSATTVSFGGVPALSFTVVDDSTVLATVGDGATGDITIVNAYGTGSISGFTHLAPVITSINPSSAGAGATVTITGDHFDGATAVTLGGTPVLSFTVNSSTSISAVVGGGSTGDVSVTTSLGTGRLSGFVFNSPPPPVITAVSPLFAPAGSSITISGSNFNSTTTGNIVFFGATQGVVTAASATQLTVTVPAGTTHQPITVLNTTTHLRGYSAQPFRLTFPNGGVVTPAIYSTRQDVYSDPNQAPTDVVASDIDGDGKPDLTFLNLYSALIVLRNTSIKDTITFAPPQMLTSTVTLNTSGQFNIGDVDGDGKPDIVYPIYTGGICVLLNTSTPGNISFTSPVTITGVAGDPWEIKLGDLDGDGRPEIVVADGGSPGVTVAILRNTSVPGVVSFASKVTYPSSNLPMHLALGDLDGDGKMDIVLSNSNSANSLSILRNTCTAGVISFAPKKDIPSSDACSVVGLADLNRDGKLDIVVMHGRSVGTLKNTSTTGIISFAAETLRSATAYSLQDLTLADIDGDGATDVVTSGQALSGFKNLSTADSIILGPPINFNGGGVGWGIKAVDLDGDGRPDLAEALPDWRFVDVLHNQAGVPYITSFSPDSGRQYTNVTIIGQHFTGATQVLFGGNSANSFTVVNDTLITAVVGAGSSGAVTVVNPKGSYDFGNFRYIPPFKVYYFTPSTGHKGSTVLISGTSLTNITSVTFGGVPASSFTSDGNTITAIVGDGASGYVKVACDTATDSLAGFTFYEPPVITGFTPNSAGFNDIVVITGHNFLSVFNIYFGGQPALWWTVVNPDSIIVHVGNGASGAVSLNTPGGTASMDGFMFAAPPTIFSFTPQAGTAGSVITIKGINLSSINKVTFGGAPARSFTIVSDTEITAIVDTGASGQVYVENIKGNSGKDGFIFARPPSLTSFSPGSGTRNGSILLTGTELTTTTGVSFGGIPAASFIVLSPTSVQAVLGEGGSGDVSVTTVAGSASLHGFVYYPAPHISSFSPDSAAKGQTVTIRGSGFTGTQYVQFGGISAASFVVVSDSVITAILNTGASGSVTVKTSYGTDNMTGFIFIVVTAINPVTGLSDDELTLAPNPAHTTVVIKYPLSYQKSYLSVYDRAGHRMRTVLVTPGTEQWEMPVGDLAKGIYTVKWTDGKKYLITTLMVW